MSLPQCGCSLLVGNATVVVVDMSTALSQRLTADLNGPSHCQICQQAELVRFLKPQKLLLSPAVGAAACAWLLGGDWLGRSSGWHT